MFTIHILFPVLLSQIYDAALLLDCGGAAPAGGRGNCGQNPLKKDQEGTCQSPPCRRHPGPIWLVLPEERRLLPWQG